MSELVKELNDLLSKHGITMNEAVRIYEKNQEKSKRLTQCYEKSENVWQYYDDQDINPCGCGSNCFHYEYDETNNKIYGVCNCCGSDIYEMKKEYVNEKLHIGKWLVK